ncbi:MAG: hypothetical protein CO071_01120 [Gallionellales bacterium CG_4_9_14_0_8_um_filter_59_50]|nr:MAG: hypothetical protein CO071_01120 [Gallionellales bacterium CG_4_9_14_0_8_um_filter_59_50]
MQYPQRKTEIVPQMSVQIPAARMAGSLATHNDFTFGNLNPIRPGAGNAGIQDRLLKRTKAMLQCL